MTEILGYTATLLFTICYIPQIVKTLRTGTVEGLSFLMLFTGLVANVVAFAYATCINQPPLQIKYTLAFCILSVLLYVYYKTWRIQRRIDKWTIKPPAVVDIEGYRKPDPKLTATPRPMKR